VAGWRWACVCGGGEGIKAKKAAWQPKGFFEATRASA
jgi:hypothetical protein